MIGNIRYKMVIEMILLTNELFNSLIQKIEKVHSILMSENA
jgi:hypothetical protein